MKIYYNQAFQSPTGWTIEVHRELAGYGQFHVKPAALFDRSVEFQFGKTRARGLALEDLLMHLVIHAAKGHCRNIEEKHVMDIARLVVRQEVNWDVYVQRAREAGCVTASWVMFQAARHIYSAPIPDRVLADSRPSPLRRVWLAGVLTTRSFPLFRMQWLPLGVGRLLVMPALIDRFRDAMACGFGYSRLRLLDWAGRFAPGPGEN